MTIICALASEDGNSVAFASDRQITFFDHREPTPKPKWIKCGDAWIGGGGSASFLYALAELSGDAAIAYGDSAVTMMKKLKACADSILLERCRDQEHLFDVTGLIILPRSGMYQFYNNLMPLPVKAGQFVAVGSGASYAFGAAHAMMNHTKHLAEKSIVIAGVRAACAYSMGCSEPIDVWTMDIDFEVRHYEYT
jgi:ATP-dependent protease HslVU (ClpYQ) peptidase subunit